MKKIVKKEGYVWKRVKVIRTEIDCINIGDTGKCTSDLEDWETINGESVDVFAVWFDRPIKTQNGEFHWITFKEKGARDKFEIIE